VHQNDKASCLYQVETLRKGQMQDCLSREYWSSLKETSVYSLLIFYGFTHGKKHIEKPYLLLDISAHNITVYTLHITRK